MCSEVGVMPAAKACEALGLPGIGLKSAEACTNKILMRKALRKKGVSVPNFYGTSVLKEAEDFAKETGFPLIIKPAVGSGSRGVRKLESMAELAEAFDNAKKISRDSRIIIEQFMEGIDTTVDCIIHKGKLEVLGIADKIKSPLPYRSDIMIYYPANFDAEIINEIIVAAKKTAEAVGLKEGPAHIEMLINNKSIRVVEIAARGGGFKTFDLIDQAVSGVDTVGESIKIALGMEVDVKPRLKRAALLYFFKENPGKLIKITGENEARKIKGVIELVITVKPGELVKEYTCGDDRIGYFVAVADTRTEIEKIQKEVESVLKFHIKKWRNE
jgi:biotin carboxylase